MRARTPSIVAVVLATAGCFTPSFVRRHDAAAPADASGDPAVDAPPDVADEPALDAPGDAPPLDAVADVAREAALDAPLDAPPDVAPDVTDVASDERFDATPDAPPDAPLDAVVDAVLDAPADVTPEAAVDVVIHPVTDPTPSCDGMRGQISTCARTDGRRCTDLTGDGSNCGACGNACPAGTDCRGGVCGPEVRLRCTLPDGAAYDIRGDFDANNCGACGNRCGRQAYCRSGACACFTGMLRCDGACVDPSASNAHCGACGNACAGGRVCVEGVCAAPPPYPQNCAEAAATNGGDRTLFFENNPAQPFSAFCDDLSSGPTTWLRVRSTDGASETNYTRNAPFKLDPSLDPGPGVTTRYEAVHVEPEHGRIYTEDDLHATNTGWRRAQSFEWSAAYGSPSECRTIRSQASTANVDLTGLPFELASTFTPLGYFPGGVVTVRSARAVDLTGGGFCGSTIPDGGSAGSYPQFLRIRYAP